MDGLRIVAAPRDENDVLAEDRARLSESAGPNGWLYVEYVDAFDLVARVAELQAERINEVEIVAHGNPAICDGVSVGNALLVAESFRRVAGVGKATAVYLSGCNTGLEFNGECIAKLFAAVFGGPVFGTRGYIAGTHAERSEHCRASFMLDGILYHAYPGGADAAGSDVWVRFGAPGQSPGGEHVQIKIATSGFRTVNLSADQGQDIVAAVEETIRAAPASSARMRMAPDLTFAIRLADGEHVFELLAGGMVLRDPVTRHVWQFEAGRAILQSLLPYRKLPAA